MADSAQSAVGHFVVGTEETAGLAVVYDSVKAERPESMDTTKTADG